MTVSDPRTVITDTILISTDGSSGVPLGGKKCIAVEFQVGANTFTATTTHVLLKASSDGTNYYWVMSPAKTIWFAEVVATTNTTGWVHVPDRVLDGARYLAAYTCSNATGTGVTQLATRTIKYICV
jgi:hypothetical protein